MKRLAICVLAAAVAIPAAMADRSTLDETKTRVAMPLPEPPVIDGFIDLDGGESWVYAGGAQPNGVSYWTIQFNENLEDFTQGGNVASGIGPIDGNDINIQMYAGYDSDYLYVAVRVVDDILFDDSAEAESQNGETWHDDSVEVFVDGDNSNYPERDTAGDKPEGWSTGGQYVVTINNAYREAEAGNPGYGPDAAWYGLADINANGNYDFEFRISMDIIGNPQPGDIIGFDIAVNDDDDGETLENQYTWAGSTHVEASYGNLVLGPRQYTAPLAPAATVDGSIADGEYDGAEVVNVPSYGGVYNGNDDYAVGDHDFSFQAIHDEEAIYVAVQVVDDTIITDSAAAGTEDGSTWLDDSVELFLDSDASDDRGRTAENLFEGQFVFTPNGAWRDNEANNPFYGETDEWYAQTSTTDDGYIVEYRIPKEILFEMQDTMGFDIAVNDDDDGGDVRKTQLAWNGRPHNESSYGDLILGPASGTPVAEWSLY